MNESRKYNKSLKIWDYHYYKKNNRRKAIKNYLGCLKIRKDNESIYFKLADCFFIVKSEKALLFVNKWLFYSSWDYDLIKLKWKILLDLWKKDEANIFLDKIKTLDEEINNTKLDLDKFYNEK